MTTSQDDIVAVPFRGEHDLPLTVYAPKLLARQAISDLLDGARLHDLWRRLAFNDIRQRFRRSILGPLWITASMGIMVGAMGLVFSTIFGQSPAKVLPFIATGLIFWGLLTGCVTEGMMIFIQAEGDIRNVPLPLSVHFYRMIARNLMIWAFNMIIYLVILVLFRLSLDWSILAFTPGFLLLMVNAAWMALAAAVISTRFRDIPQVISSLLQVVFWVTPIFWSPETLPNRPAFVEWNPFFHLLEVVRGPLIGTPVPPQSWIVCFGLAVVGTIAALWLYRRTYSRIAYWV